MYDRAPWTSNLRRFLSPLLLIPSRLALPPVLYWRGTNPIDAAKSRLQPYCLPSPISAASTLAVMGPTPGMDGYDRRDQVRTLPGRGRGWQARFPDHHFLTLVVASRIESGVRAHLCSHRTFRLRSESAQPLPYIMVRVSARRTLSTRHLALEVERECSYDRVRGCSDVRGKIQAGKRTEVSF
jgi:hypothetical protein